MNEAVILPARVADFTAAIEFPAKIPTGTGKELSDLLVCWKNVVKIAELNGVGGRVLGTFVAYYESQKSRIRSSFRSTVRSTQPMCLEISEFVKPSIFSCAIRR